MNSKKGLGDIELGKKFTENSYIYIHLAEENPLDQIISSLSTVYLFSHYQ